MSGTRSDALWGIYRKTPNLSNGYLSDLSEGDDANSLAAAYVIAGALPSLAPSRCSKRANINNANRTMPERVPIKFGWPLTLCHPCRFPLCGLIIQKIEALP
jgi:hypothetical protein